MSGTRTRIRFAATVLAVVTLGVATSGLVQADQRLPEVINGHALSLHPEGVAYDPHRGLPLVGSVRHGTVSVVNRDGTVQTLVDDPVLVSSLGVHVDNPRRRLLVANSDNGLSVRSTPGSFRRIAGLGIYDLDSGRRLHYVDLAAVAADGADHLANDVAIGLDGTAYVTDSFSPVVYRVSLDGAASVLVRDERLGGVPIGLNGIVAHPFGFLVVAHSGRAELYRIPLRRPHELSLIGLTEPIARPDGLVLRADGSLVVVQNPAGGPYAVSSLRPLDPGWRRARVATSVGLPEHVTTAAHTWDGTYVLSGRVNVLQAGRTDDTFVLRRVTL